MQIVLYSSIIFGLLFLIYSIIFANTRNIYRYRQDVFMRREIREFLRQSEYTGENRCEPCTVLNIILAGIFSLIARRKSHVAGHVAFAASLGVVYFRPGNSNIDKAISTNAGSSMVRKRI